MNLLFSWAINSVNIVNIWYVVSNADFKSSLIEHDFNFINSVTILSKLANKVVCSGVGLPCDWQVATTTSVLGVISVFVGEL